jgi:hypothetical protein
MKLQRVDLIPQEYAEPKNRITDILDVISALFYILDWQKIYIRKAKTKTKIRINNIF